VIKCSTVDRGTVKRETISINRKKKSNKCLREMGIFERYLSKKSPAPDPKTELRSLRLPHQPSTAIPKSDNFPNNDCK
jgi:hypothetical protein